MVKARERGFTMIEIALCLAIIGFALVSILLVLPSGMNTQRDTRQETIVDEDASELLETIRGGARGYDDLTNYVYAITNYYGNFDNSGRMTGAGWYGYTYTAAAVKAPGGGISGLPAMPITNGLRIVGILSTPEFINTASGAPIPSVAFGGTSNHVVAYVRSFSGLAAEKPPQNNEIMQQDTFSYRLLCVNAPAVVDTNLFQPVWDSTAKYLTGATVFAPFVPPWDYWRATADTAPGDAPGSGNWVRAPSYAFELLRNQRELRLLFEWPELPNGNVGAFRQNFRLAVGGELTQTNYNAQYPGIADLYFYQPQAFASTSTP